MRDKLLNTFKNIKAIITQLIISVIGTDLVTLA